MKIYERYSLPERIFKGNGIWSVFLPIRFGLAGMYRLYLLINYFRGRSLRSSQASLSGKVKKSTKVAYVISIGNIVVGGGGKTPCALALSKLVNERGGRPVVVTRSYRSVAEKSRKPVVLADEMKIESSECEFLAQRDFFGGAVEPADRDYALTFGDEVSIYRREGIPVVIDRDRCRAISVAEETLDPTDIILDDAYQNTAVKKDVDILLLDQSNPFADGRVLPLGRLREVPEAVSRADAVVFTRSETFKVPHETEELVKGKTVLFSRHEFNGLYGRMEEAATLADLAEERIALYSAIGNPASFEGLVEKIFKPPFCSFRFSDHHGYTPDDIEWMVRTAGDQTVFLTTEKDWFKSHELFSPHIRIYAVKIEMVIEGADKLIRGRYF